MEHSNQLKIYKRRIPQATSLWKLLIRHFVAFEECYEKHFQKKYGFYRPIISHVFQKYLECGDLHQGFARIHLPEESDQKDSTEPVIVPFEDGWSEHDEAV